MIQSAVQFMEVLLDEGRADVEAASQESLAVWCGDRLLPELVASARCLIEVSPAAGTADRAREVADDVLAWLATGPERQAAPLLATEIRNALGTLELALGDHDASIANYQAAARALEPWSGAPDVDYWAAVMRFNTANVLLLRGHAADAIAIFEDVLVRFRTLSDLDGELRAGFGRLRALRQQGTGEDLAGQLRALLRQYDSLVTAYPDLRPATKATTEPIARMLLTVLAEQGRSDVDVVDEMVGLVVALRHEYVLALPDQARSESMRLLERPLALLDRRLCRLPDTALLIWEQGESSAVLVILRSGPGSTSERAIVAAGQEEVMVAAKALIVAAQQASDVLIVRQAGAFHLDETPIVAAGKRLWAALPPPVRATMAGAGTLLFSPTAVDAIEQLPIELLVDEEGFYGVRHVVAHTPSLQQLTDTLAPNRSHRDPGARALIIRAQDPPYLDPLVAADDEPLRVARAASILGLEPTPLDPPTAAAVRELLDGDLRLLHYVGHGAAAESGEVLFLTDDERLHPGQLGGLRWGRMPFVYLSACLVGRVRHLTGGGQRGFGVALLAQGAPAVIGATYAVPDHLCGELALQFYRAAWRHPVGEALRQAREHLAGQGLHPVSWAGFALQGDPLAVLSKRLRTGGSASYTLDWPSLATRFLATSDEQYRDACLAALAAAGSRRQEASDVLAKVSAWITSLGADQPPSQCEQLVPDVERFDSEGAAALRLLLAAERVEVMQANDDAAGRQALSREIDHALGIALALQDSYAFLLFASYAARYLMHWMHLIADAELRLDALARDAPRLHQLIEPLRSLQAVAGLQGVAVNLTEMMTPDLLVRAERGDRDALSEIGAKLGRLMPEFAISDGALQQITAIVAEAFAEQTQSESSTDEAFLDSASRLPEWPVQSGGHVTDARTSSGSPSSASATGRRPWTRLSKALRRGRQRRGNGQPRA